MTQHKLQEPLLAGQEKRGKGFTQHVASSKALSSQVGQASEARVLLSPEDTTAVQTSGGGALEPATAHKLAAKGLGSPAGQLPYLDKIQASFGGVDVSAVQAHRGAEANQATAEMGASAYATGNHVVFGGEPSLHTAAHEAAHIVQQRQGVQLEGGVGKANDGYERQADTVADKVVRGESVQDLLQDSDHGSRGLQLKENKKAEKPAKGDEDKTKSGDAPDPAADFKQLLGDNLGQKAFDAIMKHLGTDKLVAQGEKAVKAGVKALEGMKDEIGLDSKSNSAIINFGDALASAGFKWAAEWLKSKDGEAFLKDTRGWIGKNPEIILTAAIVAAAGYVASVVYKGKFEAGFSISKGLKASLATSFGEGKFEKYAYESAKLKVEYIAGQIKVSAEGTHSEKDGLGGKASVKVGSGNKYLEGTVGGDSKGFSGSLKLRYGDEKGGLLGSASTKDGTNSFGTGLYFKEGGLNGSLMPEFDDKTGVGMRLKLGYDTEIMKMLLSGVDKGDGSLEDVTAELKLTPSKFFNMTLGYGNKEGKVGLEGKKGGWKGSLGMTFDDTQIKTLSAKLGFSDPDGFRRFSVAFARKVGEDGTTNNLQAIYDQMIGDFTVRGKANLSFVDGKGLQDISGGAYVAHPIPGLGDFKLIGGIDVGHKFGTDKTTVMPAFGLQLGNTPLLFKTDFKDTFSFSIELPF